MNWVFFFFFPFRYKLYDLIVVLTTLLFVTRVVWIASPKEICPSLSPQLLMSIAFLENEFMTLQFKILRRAYPRFRLTTVVFISETGNFNIQRGDPRRLNLQCYCHKIQESSIYQKSWKRGKEGISSEGLAREEIPVGLCSEVCGDWLGPLLGIYTVQH